VVAALTPVEASLLNARLSALEGCLEPGLTRLNWNSRGIDSFVATTTKAIHEFQALHHSVKKNSTVVEKLVNGLAAAQLVADLPAGEAVSCGQLQGLLSPASMAAPAGCVCLLWTADVCRVHADHTVLLPCSTHQHAIECRH
jgi:hypothetical protein